jgi:hypothetical protein
LSLEFAGTAKQPSRMRNWLHGLAFAVIALVLAPSLAAETNAEAQNQLVQTKSEYASPVAPDALRAAATISLFSRAHDPPRQYQQAARPPDSVH